MKKLTVSTFVALAVLMVFMVAAGVARADAPIVNRDFETGDLAGWTQLTTTNGAMAGGSFLAVSFDVLQGTVSRAVQFVVGQDGTSGFGARSRRDFPGRRPGYRSFDYKRRHRCP